MTTVSYIGLGMMGREMARRLVDAGHSLTIWNRSDTEAVADLVRRGATRVGTVAEALKADVAFSMLANDAAVVDQFSPEVLAEAGPSTIHVNMATVSLALADDMESTHREAGVSYLAAPVLGRPQVAAAGQLNIVAGGSPATIAEVEPLLAVMGKRTWIVGPRPRDANLVKIGVNYNILHALQALSESITLVEQGDIDPQLFVDILTDTAFSGSAHTGYGALIAGKRYSPASFPVALGLKDLSLAEQAADEFGVTLPVASVLRDMFERTLADPALADLDWSAIAEITRGLATRGR